MHIDMDTSFISETIIIHGRSDPFLLIYTHMPYGACYGGWGVDMLGIMTGRGNLNIISEYHFIMKKHQKQYDNIKLTTQGCHIDYSASSWILY